MFPEIRVAAKKSIVFSLWCFKCVSPQLYLLGNEAQFWSAGQINNKTRANNQEVKRYFPCGVVTITSSPFSLTESHGVPV